MALVVTSAIWQQVNSPAIDIRRFLSAGGQEGVVAPGDLAVAQRAAGANMSVDIAAGEALTRGDSITNQGLYYAYNDATFNLTGFAAANATLPRFDRVCLRVRDAFHGDAANDAAFVILTGTPTAGATLGNGAGAAAIPGSHLLLAHVLVPATATTITTANIDATVRNRYINGDGAVVMLSDQLLGSAGTVTFPVIQQFKHLRIVWQAANNGAAEASLFLQFNGDATANYDYQINETLNGAANVGGATGQTAMYVGTVGYSGSVMNGVIEIPNYTWTAMGKGAFGTYAGHGVNQRVGTAGGRWGGTSTVTSILLTSGGGNFLGGSRFTLYGLA